jgi:hypothetical protein
MKHGMGPCQPYVKAGKGKYASTQRTDIPLRLTCLKGRLVTNTLDANCGFSDFGLEGNVRIKF